MKRFPPPAWPILEFGLAGTILGTVAAVLILLPVLSVPLSTIGFFCGIIGVIIAWKGYPTNLRIAVVGTALCGAVLSTGLLIYFAPRNETPGRAVPRLWQQPPGRPTVSPPARISRAPETVGVG
jgi:hypothetical protein